MELAGFDVVVELHIDTLVDLINEQAVDIGGGRSVSLFGGRFSLDLPLPNLGTPMPTVRAICEFKPVPLVGSPNCRIDATVTGASGQFGSVALEMMGGAASVVVPIVFANRADAHDSEAYFPGIDFTQATPTFVFDAATKAYVSSGVGVSGAALIESGLREALEIWLRSHGIVTTAELRVSVIPGVESSEPLLLTAVPQVSWIDEKTLGAFGYHRASASGGNAALKRDSDIVQPSEEFLYDQPGLFGVMPTRRIAVLFSPFAFEKCIGCPMVVEQIVSPAVGDQRRPAELQDEHRFWDDYYKAAKEANFSKYIVEEYEKNDGQLTEDGLARAEERVRNDAEEAIGHRADERVKLWLARPEGVEAVSRATPPPCGRGRLDQQVDMPDPFSAQTAHVNEISVKLEQGFIQVTPHARCDLPICGVAVVSAPVDIRLAVGAGGGVTPAVTLEKPNVEIERRKVVCDVAVGALITYLTGGLVWGFLTPLIISLSESIAEGIVSDLVGEKNEENLNKHPPGSVTPEGIPDDVRIRDIRIEPSGLAIIMIMARHVRANEFNPRATLTARLKSRELSARQPVVHSVHESETEAGCTGGDFTYTEEFYDSVWALDLRTTDLPLPITVGEWYFDLGNFSYIFPGVRDPRPSWNQTPVRIEQPTLRVDGRLHFEEPPASDGRFEERTISIPAVGDNNVGWQLRFSGDDGNFYVRAQASVRDGNGAEYLAETFFSVSGEALVYDDRYLKYKDDCKQKTEEYIAKRLHDDVPHVSRDQIPKWVPVWDPQIEETLRLYRAVKAGGLSAAQAIAAATETGTPEMLQQVVQLPVNARVGGPATLREYEGFRLKKRPTG
jgi:hypothetical protein